MFIDYISLMLINLSAGLALLAGYVYFGISGSNQRRWIPGFGVVGAISWVQLALRERFSHWFTYDFYLARSW